AEQMKDLLRERILQREFEPSGRLPSEAQLAADFSVSRATVRTALASLAAEGLIVRRHGDGTYVNQRVLEVTTRLDSVWEFTKLIEASGRRSSIQILEEIDRPASKNEASALGIPAGSPVLVLKRLFYADERPIILSENVLPRELVCKPYSVEALTGSVLNFLRNYCEQEFSYAIADISAAAVEQNMHEFLHL